jgi:hypothetical protein
VAEVLLITFERPASMSKSEMSAVLRERGRAAPPAIALGRADGVEGGALVLRVEVREHWTGAAEDQPTDLMMGTQLLGFRPTVMSRLGAEWIVEQHQTLGQLVRWLRRDRAGSRQHPLADVGSARLVAMFSLAGRRLASRCEPAFGNPRFDHRWTTLELASLS